MNKEITNIDANYALDIVKNICQKVGPGLAGSTKERERAIIIEKELKSHLGEENVLVEKFRVAPFAFVGTYSVSAIFMFIAVLLNISIGFFSGLLTWITSITALVFSVLSPVIFILEFILGYKLIDPLFRKKESLNVIGTFRKPETKKVKRLLIISGHHDSAPENTWLRYSGYGLFFLSGTFFISFITLLIMSIIQLSGIIFGNLKLISFGTIGWILLIYPIIPSVIFGITFVKGRKNYGNVPGAADNLSACSLAVAMCRFLVKNPSYIPNDIEIRFITFGSEEAGCRGARNYIENHLDELKQLDVRLLNYETVVFPEITILTSDVNGTVKNSNELIESLVAAAKRAGIPYILKPSMLGVSNDS
ncbi:MAG: M28 family peptidase, partial [Ignavibacteriales bacterium]|nr:M28 family peptidase [Ignavibacteriales bacterium]